MRLGDMEEFEDLSEKIIETTREEVQEDSSDDTQENQLMEILLNTREQGQMVEQLIKNQIQVKDDLIDKLHKELDYYKQDSADRFVDQVMKALIKVRKDMGRQIASEGFAAMSAEELQKEYTYIYEDLTDLLEQQNIDVYSSKEGDDFDAAIHQPKLEATDDPALDKKVKESLSEGYRKKDKILIAERVVVYQYKA